MRPCPFVAVAPGTGPGQVAFLGRAATRERNNVLDVHLGAADFLGRLAVFAAVVGGGRNPVTNGLRNVIAGHAFRPG